MFPLQISEFPSTADDFVRALAESIRRFFRVSDDPVHIQAKNYPELEELRIAVDHGEICADPFPPPSVSGSKPALRVERMEISGRGISLGGASLDLAMQAREVQLNHGRDREGNIVLLLQSAIEGSVELTISKNDLQRLILSRARIEAKKHGVSIEDVRLDLRSRGSRSLDADVQVRARKLFLGATVTINGSLDIDEHLTAKLSEVRCCGDGALGTLACNFLSPILDRANNQEVSLMAIPTGKVRLRDLQLATGDTLRISAQFGTAS
jgi:hypothetical protein